MDRPFRLYAVDANNVENRQWKRQFTSQSQSEHKELRKAGIGTIDRNRIFPRAPRNVIESRLSNNMANIITHSNIFSNKMKIPKFNVETVLEQCFFLNAELKWSLIAP